MMFPLNHYPRNAVLAASAFLIVSMTEQVRVCHASGETTAVGSATECSSARARLGLAATWSGEPGSRTSICQASGKCCGIEDETKLLSRAKQFVKSSIKEQFSSLVNLTRNLSRSLDAAVCHQLSSGYERTHAQLSGVYKDAFRRNSPVLAEFYQWLHAAYADCDQCERSVEGPVREFFTTIQVFVIREKQTILALSPAYTACARRHADFSWHADLNNTFWNAVTGTRRAVCNTCLLRKALGAAARLLHEAQRLEPPASCVRRVACMQSCSCCSGGGGGGVAACARLPCRSCCHAAMSPCVDHLEGVQEALRDLVGKLAGKISFMHGSNAPDHHLSRFDGLLADWIEQTSRSAEDLRTQIESSCGHFVLGSQSTGAPLRPSSGRICSARSSSTTTVHSVLKTLKARLSRAIKPTLHIKHGACRGHSASDSPCNDCPTCGASDRSGVSADEELRSTLKRQSMALLTFQSSIPELYEVHIEAPSAATASGNDGGECDDEDADCADASGGSGGSGDTDTVTSQAAPRTTPSVPPQSESRASQLPSTEERTTKPYESGAPHPAAVSGVLLALCGLPLRLLLIS